MCNNSFASLGVINPFSVSNSFIDIYYGHAFKPKIDNSNYIYADVV
jgi:hypothetical protein